MASSSPRSVTVFASSEIFCLPDEYTIEVTLTRLKPTLTETRYSLQRRREGLLSLATTHGVPSAWVDASESLERVFGTETDRHNLSTGSVAHRHGAGHGEAEDGAQDQERDDDGEDEERRRGSSRRRSKVEFLGYRGTIKATLRSDLARISKVYEALLVSDDDAIGGVAPPRAGLSAEKLRDAKGRALMAAVLRAQMKAENLCAHLASPQTIGRAVTIQELGTAAEGSEDVIDYSLREQGATPGREVLGNTQKTTSFSLIKIY
jgi:hypothetical protein